MKKLVAYLDSIPWWEPFRGVGTLFIEVCSLFLIVCVVLGACVYALGLWAKEFPVTATVLGGSLAYWYLGGTI